MNRVALTVAGVTVAGMAVLALLAGGSMAAYARMYDGRVFPGVRLLGVRLDGLTPSDARKAVNRAIDKALAGGLEFRYHGARVTLPATTLSTDPDAARDLIRYSVDAPLKRAFELGRRGGWQANMLEELRLRLAPVEVGVDVAVDRAAITDALNDAFHDALHEVVNARLTLKPKSVPPELLIQPEERGVALIVDPALDELTRQAKDLSFAPIELSDRLITPVVTGKDLEPLLPAARGYLERPSLAFTYEASRFRVTTSTLAGWITATGTRGALVLTLDPDAFAADIKMIAKDVEQEGKNGSLVVKEGKIQSFVAGTEGRSIDAQATLAPVLAEWPATSTFRLVVVKTPGTLEGADPEQLGIKELLGVGTSNFSGSPVNRRKNIAHGVALVNGTIIQPDETFSLLKTLGPVDGVHKWLPELVIKGNETKPEFGGGLCQIGTTTFRATIASGLPVLERQNHSYRVRYYEPAGTDATIYEPKPDFRFMNDTGFPILINAYAKGDNAFFEFWGTKDGRVAEQTTPKISNVTPPPPMKLVETLDLPVGKQKCTEVAHNGADAEFSYTVTYPAGDVKKQVFQSHYRPWQAVCLIGVEKLTPTSTEVVVN